MSHFLHLQSERSSSTKKSKKNHQDIWPGALNKNLVQNWPRYVKFQMKENEEV